VRDEGDAAFILIVDCCEHIFQEIVMLRAYP